LLPFSSYPVGTRFLLIHIDSGPLEQAAPVVELVDRSAAAVRHALTRVGRGRVAGAVLDDLLLGTSEAVNNAMLYGHRSATVRVWAGPDRIVVQVHDHGRGPAHPRAGLIPPAGNLADAELGLWLIHQLGIDVALSYGDDGFAVRLRAGPISA
jgi:anti-sigma regulatory factor (Ser/Thr protein kinase)